MKEYIIKENEAGQTLLKFLQKYMPLTPVSFFYKMLRKKNIKYNRQRADGKEKLVCGDCIQLFLSDETIAGFQQQSSEQYMEYHKAYQMLKQITVVYENEHLVICNKPAGVLTQKAAATNLSLNEWLIGYLLATNAITKQSLTTFHPSVLNRLDRNTYGLVLCSKSLAGSRIVSEWIHDRKIRKFYRMIVKGTGLSKMTLRGSLSKDTQNNRVHLCQDQTEGEYIETHLIPLREFHGNTLVEAELITGKTHQIRIHLSSIGHPLIGDYKYGDAAYNQYYNKKFHVKSQLLAACRLEFPETEGILSELSNKVISIPEPELFSVIMKESEK